MLIYENQSSKMKLFGCQVIFFRKPYLKMGIEINLRIIKKNNGADTEIGFPTKSILKPFGRTAAMPTAWE